MSHAIPKNPIIKEIESALHAGSNEARTKVLMRVTDLFIGGAAQYTENNTKLFDDVMSHLVKHVESRALVELSIRLAPIENAPAATIQRLARNDAIEISGPILTNSKRLSDDDLIEIAQTKSQAHLTNIARRLRLNPAVTDVLVDRGDADVANEVATNSGAQFTKLSMAKLVMRADGDDRLTESISRRPDISPALFRQLLIQATEKVRLKLLASAKPSQKDTVRHILDDISVQVGKNSNTSRNYAEAKRIVASFSQSTELTKSKISEFADANKIAEIVVSLSVLSELPVDQIDRLFYASSDFALMILCKAIPLEWNTAHAVIMARHCYPTPADMEAFDDLREQYNELSVSSAQRLIRFWKGRQMVAQHFQASKP